MNDHQVMKQIQWGVGLELSSISELVYLTYLVNIDDGLPCLSVCTIIYRCPVFLIYSMRDRRH